MSAKKKSLSFMTICMIMFLTIGLQVQATGENNAVLGTLQVLPADAEVKESPDMNSATIGNLKAGTAVIVESQDGEWTKVLYQDIEGYISDAVVSSFESYIAEDSERESLEQEMLSVAEEEQRITEEYELILKQKRTSVIWGVVIAILIVLIIGLGVVSAVRNVKEEAKKEREEAESKATEDIEIEEIEEIEDIKDIKIENTEVKGMDEEGTAKEEEQV